ncbi:MAG: hypothetical protein ABI599_17895 [Flavobacteriales bacterium]
MNKTDFRFLLLGASYAAFKFAEEMVSDRLTTEFRYNVFLNISNDSPELEQFDVYPEDAGVRHLLIKDQEVVDLLCRNEKVPVWIDVSVESVVDDRTVLRLLCSGRFSSESKAYYYQRNGSGPFGIKSPVFPPDHKEGVRFNLQPLRYP